MLVYALRKCDHNNFVGVSSSNLSDFSSSAQQFSTEPLAGVVSNFLSLTYALRWKYKLLFTLGKKNAQNVAKICALNENCIRINTYKIFYTWLCT